MKSKTEPTPAKKKSPIRESTLTGTATVQPPVEAAVSAVPSSPVAAPAAKKPAKKPLLETVVNAAKKILKPKTKTSPAKTKTVVQTITPEKVVEPVKPAVAVAPKVETAQPVVSPVEAPKSQVPKAEVAKAPAIPKPAAAKTAPAPQPAAAVATPPPVVPVPPVAPVVATPPEAVSAPDPETKTSVTAATVVRRTYTTKKKKVEAPAILTESDSSPAPALAGPGKKFSLGPTPVRPGLDGPEGELPDAYGTKKLFITARDPHWLYAHWDLTLPQQQAYNAESSDGHLVLRVYGAKFEGHPIYEIHVHPESRHWFIHVERAGNSYCAELGYYSPIGKWMRIASSSATITPPDAASAETAVEFATIPFEFPFAKLMHIISEAVSENLPLAQAIEELRRAGHPDLPRFKTTAGSQSPVLAYRGENRLEGQSPAVPAPWTPEQEQALAKVICIDQSRRIWMGSLEITELIRRRLTQEARLDISSPMRAFGAPEISALAGPAGPASLSSPAVPFGAAPAPAKSFWFNVNAELIVYGATEPGAKVTLGGHEIKLRPDGTFSYRFALPDGVYDLPAVAVSADGTDGRAADLKFSRETQYLGEVGAQPQDPSLKAPLPDNLSAAL